MRAVQAVFILGSILGSLALAGSANAEWSIGGTQNPDGSYRSPVTVTLSGADSGSGVCHIYYTLDGGPQVDSTSNPTSFVVTADGAHTVAFFAEDCAGNQSATETFNWTQSSATPTPTASATPTQTLTPTATNTPVPTPTSTPTPTPTVTNTPAPIIVTLSADYANLVLFASKVGMPAQTLRCAVTGGGGAPYDVLMQVTNPGGATALYNLSTDAAGVCALTPALAGDPDFGTTVQGQWTAKAFSGGQASNSVFWFVAWFPVHERP